MRWRRGSSSTAGAAPGSSCCATTAASARIEARAVLLATGGAGRVYRETTNPAIATGDGLAMAWRAGARVSDLEFVQFHPTVLHMPGAPRFLVSEAVRGEGARLINADGEAFMPRYDTRGDLAPRDVVATALVQEAHKTGRPVFLSLAHLDAQWVSGRFPGIAEACRKAGLDFARDLLPVSPAAHYMCGGVDTDLFGRTSIPGLFAAGEVACTRRSRREPPGEQLLLEGLVFAARAAASMPLPEREARLPPLVEAPAAPPPVPGSAVTSAPVPDRMWRDAGLVRDAATLAPLARDLDAEATALETSSTSGAAMPATGGRQPGARWRPHRQGRTAPRRKPRRTPPCRLPRHRRCTLEDSRRRETPTFVGAHGNTPCVGRTACVLTMDRE